jgi:hypothetical protein
MLFTNPIWLWALVGLSIPIGIHLLSRKEGQIIRIGSLRHLQETNTQQFKGIRLNEIVLLMLRCVMIIVFVLLMSGLSFDRTSESQSKWILIERGLEKIREVQAQVDTFRANGYEVHWFAEGFPLYADSASVSIPILYWKLAEQLQAKKVSDIVVVSKNSMNGFKGMRPQLAGKVRWISVPMGNDDFLLKATVKGDSVIIREGHAQADKTYFTTRNVSHDNWDQTANNPDSIEVVIVSDNTRQYDRQIVETALQTIRMFYPIEMKLTQVTPESFKSAKQWGIWLSDKPVSESIKANVIYLKPGSSQEILVQEKANRWVITKRLNEEVALNESFTVGLASLLLSSKKDWEVADRYDQRMLADESSWSNNDGGGMKKSSFSRQSADSYLLALFLITLLVERLLAYYRKQ